MKSRKNALILTANKLRHQYFVKTVSDHFNLLGVITQPKKKYYKSTIYESELVRGHFERLAETEHRYFGDYENVIHDQAGFEVYETDDINDEKCVAWAREKGPEVIFLFGTRILGDAWFHLFDNIINLHLGLSPFYRGSATLFWPFVNGELGCVGVTIHLAVKEVDAGPILRRIKPEVEVGDDYYEINYKAIKGGIDSIPYAVQDYLNGKLQPISQDLMKKERSYKKKDFDIVALNKALSFIGDGVTEEQLKNEVESATCNCSQ